MLHEAVNLRGLNGRLKMPEECIGYRVCDPLGQTIGTVEEIFVNGDGGPEYVKAKIGLFGTKTVLIPVVSVSVYEGRKSIKLE